jgi:hypothetical protein
MRLIGMVAGIVALGLTVFGAQAAQAQAWVSYVSEEDQFAHWFPAEPTMEDYQWTDTAGQVRSGHKYSAERRGSTYVLYVVDYDGASEETYLGAVEQAAAHWREMGEVTFDDEAQVDRIPGHQLQITLPDDHRIFWAAFRENQKIYILEANMVPRAAPPIQFQQSLQLIDDEGVRIRYGNDGERIIRTDDLAEGLGGATIGGCILQGTSDEYICPEGVEPPAQ